MTILVSTSYMEEATLCGRIAMIDKGHILETGTPDELISGLGDNLWQSSAKEMFALLEEYRKMPEVIDCYTFGAHLHIVANTNFNPQKICEKLSPNFKDFELSKAKGTIEDLFIKFSRENHNA